MGRILNVSNRLPVTIDGDQIKKSSGGLVSALEGVTDYGGDGLQWIGWPGGAVDDPQRQEFLRKTLDEQFGYVPVFLSAEQIEGFYHGFSNSSLWPLLHYMPSKFRYQRDWWEHYRKVNEHFAEAVLSIAKPDDTVWVHDYQLMLLPSMLKRQVPTLKVGFFLHTPFPSSELFRYQPKRQDLLDGVLGADQIGFHTFQYLRHFRSTVLRVLGVESEGTRIRREGHSAYLGIYPIGINAGRFERTLDSPQFRNEYEELRAAHEGKRIVFSVERLDYTKGILHRLEAINLFLAQYPDRENVRFIFVNVPSREEIAEYRSLLEEVEARVGRLNGKYSTLQHTPIHFIHGSVDFTRLCAMYALADVGLVTPLVDGMNLVAKEYVACQRDHAGALVLSEFAGAAAELFNATLVNPYDAQSVADALADVLRATPEERKERIAPMRQRVMKCDANWWAHSFLDDLSARPSCDCQPASDRAQLDDAAARLAAAIHAGQRTALFLDYDGTLRELERDPGAASPNGSIRAVLEQLQHVPNLDVTLITGRRAADMEQWFGDTPFAIVAEHGADIRRAGTGQWDRLDRHVNYAWKDDILPVLRHYADSTPGSFVEVKRTGLVWHYRKADPEFGTAKANELAEELSTLLANQPVQIRHGKKIIEVAAAQVNKGEAVARLMDENHYALALCAGDDQTDESMFTLHAPNLITMKVGRGDTAAQLRILSPAALRRFLMDFAEAAASHEVGAGG
ncbi:MAG TPA: bifunctional alpha,alpha-trehalose-phosphate synthase (UDP-forming)/trehalose-phosphatase [Tepidisphaeraceae bacterium]|jgi:trehalose 6-phosphate synthase/phosphatase